MTLELSYDQLDFGTLAGIEHQELIEEREAAGDLRLREILSLIDP